MFEGRLILKKNTVILSVNNDEGNLCVDIFIRKNKTFGFEEYRKDPENIDGWYKVGNYSDKIYSNQKEAFKDACEYIMWFKNKK